MLLIWSPGVLFAQNDLVKISDLSGTWKFSIGDREEWFTTSYDDSRWESVRVPSSWEDQGFYGYNGYAVYRKKFTISPEHEGKTLYLMLGYIDDVDETYINGKKIGITGSFPPGYVTAYNARRVYPIPGDLLNFDKPNVVVVKVYDSQLAGGIVSGEVGIYGSRFDMQPEINLNGSWKFRTGDDMGRREPSFNDASWNQIFVPGKWEDQGYRDYDGMAWYRKSFYYKGEIGDETAIVLLGRIDDFDEVYLNGKLIGSTGQIKPYGHMNTGEQWRALRTYYISTDLLKKNQTNTIAVRVYDGQGGGGIYEGPIGIISQSRFINFWRSHKQKY